MEVKEEESNTSLDSSGSSSLPRLEEEPPEERHCAFCLKQISKSKVMLCGKCHRRAYCSKSCQKLDWSTKTPSEPSAPVGQGHKNWCGINVGEEDLDWKVVPIEGKGLGVIALRNLPCKYRIMVEGCQLTASTTHPGFPDLMPVSGSERAKFRLNELSCGEDNDEAASVVCLRMSRLNHRCLPNAGHLYESKFKVKVLFSEMEIAAGEEITICYVGTTDVSKNITPERGRLILSAKWGVECPNDCWCRNVEVQESIRRAKDLDANILQLATTRPDQALRSAKALMELHEKIHSSWVNRSRTMYDLFQIAVLRRKTVKVAKEYIGPLHEVISAIGHPQSSKALTYEDLVRDMKSHRNYLLMD